MSDEKALQGYSNRYRDEVIFVSRDDFFLCNLNITFAFLHDAKIKGLSCITRIFQ